METTLILGGYPFADFEVPGAINFGGKQRHYVHRFLDGSRLVDVLGQDDADIVWSGTFAGSDAVERARAIDILRVTGAASVLTWDSFVYEVIVTMFEANYESPCWIPYRIECTIVLDEASALIETLDTVSGMIANDLTSASEYVDTSSIASLPFSESGITPGTASFAANTSAVVSYQTGLQSQIDQIGSGLPSLDLGSAVSSAGTLANLVVAQGYIGRIANNLAAATT